MFEEQLIDKSRPETMRNWPRIESMEGDMEHREGSSKQEGMRWRSRSLVE